MLSEKVKELQDRLTHQYQDYQSQPRQTHHLKTWTGFFKSVASGEKTFEIRKNDRNFQTGDLAFLWEYDPLSAEPYSGKYITCTVGYVLTPELVEQYNNLVPGQTKTVGVEPGYCVWVITRLDASSLLEENHNQIPLL